MGAVRSRSEEKVDNEDKWKDDDEDGSRRKNDGRLTVPDSRTINQV